DARHEEEPQQRIAELRTDGRIRRDTAGLVAREPGDDARAEHGEERGEGDAAAGRAAPQCAERSGEAGAPHLAIDLSDLFLQPRGSMMSTTSSIVTVPRSFRRAST